MPDNDSSPPSPAPSPAGPSGDLVRASLRRYWRANIKIMILLLGIWALVGLGCGVLFADRLNEIKVSGFPLGFWFAQQGSILVFVALILVYGLWLNRLDAKHHAEIQGLRNAGAGQEP